MKRKRPAVSALWVPFITALILAGGASAVLGSLRPPPRFQDTIKTAHDRISASMDLGARRSETGALFDDPRTRLVEISGRVFEASPETREAFRHLEETALHPRSEKDWKRIQEFEQGTVEALGRKGVPVGPRFLRVLSLVEAAMMWYSVQYEYDRAVPYRKGARMLDEGFQEPVEIEGRGRAAACKFMRSGIRNNIAPGAEELPDVFECKGGIPSMYYCWYSPAVEFVVLTGTVLQKMERPLPKEGVPPPTGESAEAVRVLERGLEAYCAEFERVRKGDPLSMEEFRFEWSTSECVQKAIDAVLSPDYVSSLEMCPAEVKFGPDVRDGARKLKGWK